MNGCDEELLSAYYDGELPEEEKSRAEQLLADDVAAREVLDEVAEVSGWIRDLPRASAPASLREDVLARIRKPAPPAPLSSAPARSNWRRQANWAAVSAVGLLLAVVLYRAWPTAAPASSVAARVALHDRRLADESEARDFAMKSEGRADSTVSGFTRAPDSLAYDFEDTVEVAMSNSFQVQDRFADLLKRGEAPVAGEELTRLAQVGDQIVVITYRIVDIEKLPGAVQLILTNNGITEISSLQPGGEALAEAAGHEQLEAFYVEAPEPNFSLAVTDFTSLDGVTAVTTNFVSTASAPTTSVESLASQEQKAEFPRLRSAGKEEAELFEPLTSPVPSTPSAPFGVTADDFPPADQPESPTVAAPAIEATLSTAAPAANAYQVAVRAQKELVEELQEQEQVFLDRDGGRMAHLEAAPQQLTNRAALHRNWYFDQSRVQGPPVAPNRVRAVILLVPEKSE